MPDFCSGQLENLSFFSYNSYAGRVQRNLCPIVEGANGYCYQAGEFGSQVKFYEEFRLQKNCEITSAHEKVFGAG